MRVLATRSSSALYLASRASSLENGSLVSIFLIIESWVLGGGRLEVTASHGLGDTGSGISGSGSLGCSSGCGVSVLGDLEGKLGVLIPVSLGDVVSLGLSEGSLIEVVWETLVAPFTTTV